VSSLLGTRIQALKNTVLTFLVPFFISATVLERMLHCDFFEDFPDSQLFPSVHDAVLFAQQSAKS
jgi:hypothetical protein